ncbi:Uncharacterised protein [Mycobacterium tuberculosis]|nr:Uncharacterised protein [Mycobacterium tuberculosis]CNV80682.1 Uncharacterised protein [Mycobacterium tuberculosis]
MAAAKVGPTPPWYALSLAATAPQAVKLVSTLQSE